MERTPWISGEQASVSADTSSASGGVAVEDAANNSKPPASDGSAVGVGLAGLGAATVAFAHLTSTELPAPRANGKTSRLTRGMTARFLGWICKVVPEVFEDLRDRGLLQVLVDLLRSSTDAERPDVEAAVAGLAIQIPQTCSPLRALRAITPLTENLKVCPELIAHAAKTERRQVSIVGSVVNTVNLPCTVACLFPT
jgi:hypothetical protein